MSKYSRPAFSLAMVFILIVVALTAAMNEFADFGSAVMNFEASVTTPPTLAVAHNRLLLVLATLCVPLLVLGTFPFFRRWSERELSNESSSKVMARSALCLVLIAMTVATFFFDESDNCRICVHTSLYLNMVFRIASWMLLAACVNISILGFKSLTKGRKQ